MKILGLEIKAGTYQSDTYQMYVNGSTYRDLQKELNKTYYIEDKKLRLLEVRKLLKDVNRPKVHVSKGVLPDFKGLGFTSIKDYLDATNKSMFFGQWMELSNKRKLEIEVYVLGIYDIANTKAESSKYDAICYLIDEQFKEHTGVFDNEKDDFVYRGQYNQLIFDLLQKQIAEINNIEVEDVREQIKAAQNKSLEWVAQKTIIGTIFGLLYNAKAIKGTKADLNRALVAMFPNLSKNTVHDNLNLKINTYEQKVLYSEQTEKLLKDFIEYVKSTTT